MLKEILRFVQDDIRWFGLNEKTPLFVLITGLPGTGKTTLARQIATSLILPLVSKDGIKEILLEQLGTGDRAWSKRLSTATYQVMFHLFEEMLSAGVSLVAEANYPPLDTRDAIKRIRDRVYFRTFEVNCVTEGEILMKRFTRRGELGKRHPGHLDKIVHAEVAALVAAGETGSLDLGDEFWQVDSSDFDLVRVDSIVAAIQKLL